LHNLAAMSGKVSDLEIPPGWDYNPSAWRQRYPIIALSLMGVAIAGYLALYQIGVFDSVWEPFFGDGSQRILTSWVSELMHPVPDAALGAFGYLVDAITGAVGGRRRWRTMPWMVVIFGLAIGPLGVVSVLLVILQPVLFDSWCTLCLASGVVSVVMIGPAMDETLASLQHLKRVRERGESTWQAFWGAGQRQAA
jgi:type IV secretory pathway VirB3-like protein